VIWANLGADRGPVQTLPANCPRLGLTGGLTGGEAGGGSLQKDLDAMPDLFRARLDDSGMADGRALTYRTMPMMS